MIVLVPPIDLLARDDEALLLYEGELMRVSAIAAAVVELARDGVDIADLIAALETRFGRPAAVTTAEATRTVVADLVQRGVLRWPELDTADSEDHPLERND